MDSTIEPKCGSDSSLCSTSTQRVGPKVRVRIEYECNGCQFHKVDADPESDTGAKYHACHHPSVVEQYSTAQWFGGRGCGTSDLTIYHIAPTPTYLCPYLAKAKD